MVRPGRDLGGRDALRWSPALRWPNAGDPAIIGRFRRGSFAALLLIAGGLRYLGIECYFMNVMFGLFNLGGGEIILILALVLILFGAKKLPELAKGLGTGIKEFKKATRDVTEEMHTAMEETPHPPAPGSVNYPAPSQSPPPRSPRRSRPSRNPLPAPRPDSLSGSCHG